MAKEQSFRGKVVSIGETETVGANGFTKRGLEMLKEGEYPENYMFEFQKDKTSLLDDVLEDTYVTVHYNLRSRKVSETRDGLPMDKPMFFVTLVGWKVEM